MLADYFELAAIQSHQVSLSGGSEKTTFFVSGNFFKDKGVVINQDFSRYSFRINLDHQVNSKVKIGTSTLVLTVSEMVKISIQ